MYIIWLLPTFVSGCILRCISQLSGTIFTTGTTDSWLAELCCSGWCCLSGLFFIFIFWYKRVVVLQCDVQNCAKSCCQRGDNGTACDSRNFDTLFLFLKLSFFVLVCSLCDCAVTPTRQSFEGCLCLWPFIQVTFVCSQIHSSQVHSVYQQNLTATFFGNISLILNSNYYFLAVSVLSRISLCFYQRPSDWFSFDSSQSLIERTYIDA